jgi:hypothetical protein
MSRPAMTRLVKEYGLQRKRSRRPRIYPHSGHIFFSNIPREDAKKGRCRSQ